jgi:hypothetical protein
MDRKIQSRLLMQQRREMLRANGWKTLTVYVKPEDEDALRSFLATLPQPPSKRVDHDRDSDQH